MDFYYGARKSPSDPRDLRYHFAATVGLKLPAPTLPVSAPLPPGHPWNQGEEGTCVGHGVGLAIVVAIWRKTGKWIVSSPDAGHRLARDLYHLANPTDSSYQQGTDIRSAVDAATNIGVLGGDGKRYRISSYHTLMPSPTNDLIGDIERAIAGGFVVATAWAWPRNWEQMADGSTDFPFHTLPEPDLNDIAGGHCVAIWRAANKHPAAGDPSLRRDHNIENSWGAGWGHRGCVYFDSSTETTSQFMDAYVVVA